MDMGDILLAEQQGPAALSRFICSMWVCGESATTPTQIYGSSTAGWGGGGGYNSYTDIWFFFIINSFTDIWFIYSVGGEEVKAKVVGPRKLALFSIWLY